MKRRTILEAKEFDQDRFQRFKKMIKDKPDKNNYIMQYSIKNNPLCEDNDLYVFIARPKFIKNEDGSYNKSHEIEKMVKFSAESKEFQDIHMLKLRTRYQQDGSVVYFVWIPKDGMKTLLDLEDDTYISGNELDTHLIDSIMEVSKPI